MVVSNWHVSSGAHVIVYYTSLIIIYVVVTRRELVRDKPVCRLQIKIVSLSIYNFHLIIITIIKINISLLQLILV